MKYSVNLVRIIVGLLFIFSGLIKANDPLGLSYKMQEFFELWHLNQFNGQTFWLSIFMIVAEIVAGVALLLGWRMKIISWFLLMLIIFFTFLTGYAYLSGKFKNCGCFGDCIPITAFTSFIKDLILTILIVIIFIYRKFIQPVFSKKITGAILLLATLLSFIVQWYTVKYLPVLDCLPYKIGNNIPQQMKAPAGSMPDSFAIRFVYEKGGKQYEFAPADLPGDLDTYNYVSRKDKLVREGNAEPPIKGFVLTDSLNQDSTSAILSKPRTVILFIEDFSNPTDQWKPGFERLIITARSKLIPVYIVTNRMKEAQAIFSAGMYSGIPILSCDYTTIRTVARTKPTILTLENGTIKNKKSYVQMDAITKQIASLP